MALFWHREEYDRARILDAAARARSRRRRTKAIALYRRVLAVEPHNTELHLKLGALLAESGQPFDAWIHYRTAARAYAREERLEKAAAIYRDASQRLPRTLEVWLELAELERRRERRGEAVRALLDGRFQFRSRGRRPEAIHLLRRARNLEPRRLDVLLDLVKLLARTGQEPEALLLLERAEKGSSGTALRQLRGARFRISHRVGDLWQLLRTPRDGASRARFQPRHKAAIG